MLFLPTSTFLPYFSPGSDVLVFRDLSGWSFSYGVPGYANTFAGVMRAAERDFNFGRYGRIVCFGASGGGVPALAAGIMCGADRAVSVSGRFPSRSRRHRANAVGEIEGIVRKSSGSGTRFYIVYARESERDGSNASDIASAFDATVWPIGGLSGHNPIAVLHEQRKLRDLFVAIGLIK